MTLGKGIINQSKEDTNKQPVRLKKKMQIMNVQHRKEWESIRKFQAEI